MNVLVGLVEDWERYGSITDREWRNSMRRAVVIEMQAEVARLAEKCGLNEMPLQERAALHVWRRGALMPRPKNVQRDGEPFNRLTRLADAMLQAAPTEDRTGLKAIVILSHGDDNATALAGWEDDGEAMAFLLIHVEAIFKANGQTLTYVPMENPPGQG